MTPEQRYLFDVTGYLHLENALTGDTLQETQEAIDRYIQTPEDELPPGFEIRDLHQHGFAFDKCLEALTLHPATWHIVKELTFNKPRFARGSLKREQHTDWKEASGHVQTPVDCIAPAMTLAGIAPFIRSKMDRSIVMTLSPFSILPMSTPATVD